MPKPSPDLVDVAVLGGGPAGASAALLLARWGHSVIVLTREPRTPPLAESLPPSIEKLFGLLGVQEEIRRAGFLRTGGNTAWWGGSDARREAFDGGALGYQVLRSDFDRCLLDAAERAGADVRAHSGVSAVDVTGAAPRSVVFEAAEGERSVLARWVLDCTGRAGVVAKQGLRKHHPGAATLALVGVWERHGGWPVPDESHTLVESYRDGWAWSVPTSRSVRYFTAMVDPRATGLDKSADMVATYRGELGKTEHLSGLLGDATLTGPPWACTASTYSAEGYGGDGFLLVGDAGSFIDPLSSYGVKKALASAWLASVVVHTCLGRPSMQEPALELFERREGEIFDAYRGLSASFALEAGEGHGHRFWEARSEVVDELTAGSIGGEPDVRELRDDPDVLHAFDRLRAAPSIAFRPGAGLDFVRAPTVEGREVVLQARVRLPGLEPPVRALRSVVLPTLIEMAPRFSRVPDLYEAYCEAVGQVALPDFLGALSVLLAKGGLVE